MAVAMRYADGVGGRRENDVPMVGARVRHEWRKMYFANAAGGIWKCEKCS